MTITATRKIDKIVWDMGDGASVTCTTSGTVCQHRFGFDMSSDCGHRYTKTSADKPDRPGSSDAGRDDWRRAL